LGGGLRSIEASPLHVSLQDVKHLDHDLIEDRHICVLAETILRI
jgi:hypothetical protein